LLWWVRRRGQFFVGDLAIVVQIQPSQRDTGGRDFSSGDNPVVVGIK
jgi:hypothetical protein